MLSEFEVASIMDGEDVAIPINYYRHPISTGGMKLTDEERDYLYEDELALWDYITTGEGNQPKVYITDLLRKLSSERRGIGT